MKRFEYHIFEMGSKIGLFGATGEMDISVLDLRINELGAEGWELVSTLGTGSNGWTTAVIMVFKRERQD